MESKHQFKSNYTFQRVDKSIKSIHDTHNVHKISKNLYMKSYDDLQLHTLSQAKQLASNGEEFAHLIKLLAPEFALRLKIHVQNLPQEIANMTIYGRAHTAKLPETKKRKK